MVGAIILLLFAGVSAFVGFGILVGALQAGSFSGLPDQIVMMTSLIMFSVFLVGSFVLGYLGLLLEQMKRSRELTARSLGHSPAIAKALSG